jgi:hypothetical protein
MRIFSIVAALACCLLLITSNVLAQGTGAQQRAQELAAAMSKSKHSVKEKHGVRVEKFKEIRSEPAMRSDVRSYAGAYESDMGYALSLQVAANGQVEGSGSEPSPKGGTARYTLRDARIEGALLTGTKVYEDGSTERVEGVFINRTERDSPQASGVTSFGIGVVYDPPKVNPEFSFSITRLFYQRK